MYRHEGDWIDNADRILYQLSEREEALKNRPKFASDTEQGVALYQVELPKGYRLPNDKSGPVLVWCVVRGAPRSIVEAIAKNIMGIRGKRVSEFFDRCG